MLRWRLKQQCCVGDSSSHVAMSHGSSSQVAMLHVSNSIVISCEENHDRLTHGRLDVHSRSLTFHCEVVRTNFH